MELLAMPLYDLIVANPPFSKGQDMLHIMQMIKHLKPGGRIVSLMRNIEVDDRKIRDANLKTLTHQGRIHKQFIEFLDKSLWVLLNGEGACWGVRCIRNINPNVNICD